MLNGVPLVAGDGAAVSDEKGLTLAGLAGRGGSTRIPADVLVFDLG